MRFATAGGGGGLGNLYTPVASALSNFASVTPLIARAIRADAIVFVTGTLNFQPTGAGACVFELTLPFASPGLTTNDLSGLFQVTDLSVMTAGGSISGFTANRARFSMTAVSGAAAAMRYWFGYTILP